jgi:peptide/nickel transport system substrate-binding protein
VRKRFTALLVGGALLFLVLVMPSSAHGADPAQLSVGTKEAVTTLDPRHGDGAVAREIWKLQYPTLVALDAATLDPQPGVARQWSPSPDGRGWIYSLGDMHWSDGQPVTADDVVYSLQHARDEHWPYAGSMLDDLDARKVDDKTVEITSGRNSALLPTLLLHVVPAYVFEHVENLDDDADASSVGAGRWHVVSRDGDEVRLGAVDPAAAPPVQDIVYRSYRDDDALLDAIASGEVDAVSGVSPEHAARLRALDGVTTTHANDGTQYVLIAGNTSLRQTVFDILDRQAIVDAATGGIGRGQTVPHAARGSSWNLEEPATSPSRPQPNLKPNIPVSDVTIGAAADDATGERIADEIVRQIDHAGMGFSATRTEGDADFTVVKHDASDDPTPVLAELTCAAGHWCDASYDALYERFVTDHNPSSRAELARRMLQRAVDQHVETALLAPDTLQAFRSDHISGWLRRPDEQRLVVFAPSVESYDQLTPAMPPPGEDPGNGILLAGGVALAVIFGGLFATAVLLRRRNSAPDSSAPRDVAPA